MAEKEKIEDMEVDEKEKKELEKKIKKYKYIGESSRSIYKRGLEHQRDFEEMKPDSHTLPGSAQGGRDGEDDIRYEDSKGVQDCLQQADSRKCRNPEQQ